MKDRRGSYPESVELGGVTAPPRAHLDGQLEEDRGAHRGLDGGPGLAADPLHHRAAAADQDRLLRLGLADELGLYDGAVAPRHDRLDEDGHGVRYLVAGQLERPLADEL